MYTAKVGEILETICDEEHLTIELRLSGFHAWCDAFCVSNKVSDTPAYQPL